MDRHYCELWGPWTSPAYFFTTLRSIHPDNFGLERFFRLDPEPSYMKQKYSLFLQRINDSMRLLIRMTATSIGSARITKVSRDTDVSTTSRLTIINTIQPDTSLALQQLKFAVGTSTRRFISRNWFWEELRSFSYQTPRWDATLLPTTILTIAAGNAPRMSRVPGF